jgi:hypothetical protein
MYGFREFVSDGGLLSYGPNLMEIPPVRHLRGQDP